MTINIDSDTLMKIFLAIFASAGFWQFIIALLQNKWQSKQNKVNKQDANDRLLLGLAYRSICELCEKYIARGSITKDEYEDLLKYLYQPYQEKGGNGTCAKLIEEVNKLPLVNS